jgi:hypothetical protein
MSAFPLPASHRDFPTLAPLAAAIQRRAGGAAGFAAGVPPLFRQAVDEVIDAPRTNRFTIVELEKTEKTYLGTKVEILLRDFLKLPKGRVLDLSVDGVEVDIKNTMQRAWTIPLESHGHPALLLRLNETTALCDVGLVVVRPEYLNAGQNRDAKKTLSAEGTSNIWWLLHRQPYPPNFWEVLPGNDRQEIFAAGSASARLALLFAKLQRQPISRLQVQAVAQQHDYMKRLRRNGGARDSLLEEGIALLSGRTDGALISALGLGPVSIEEFISLSPETDRELALLAAAGQLS